MLTLATKKLSGTTRANGQKEDAASFFCPRSFDRAIMGYLPEKEGRLVLNVYNTEENFVSIFNFKLNVKLTEPVTAAAVTRDFNSHGQC